MTSIAAYLANLAGGGPQEGQNTSQADSSGAMGLFAALLSSTNGETGAAAGITGEAGILAGLPDSVLGDPVVLNQLSQLAGNDPELAALLSQGIVNADGNADGDVEAQIVEPLTGTEITATADIDVQAADAEAASSDSTNAEQGKPATGTPAAAAVTPSPAQTTVNGPENQTSAGKEADTGLSAAVTKKSQTADQPQTPARNTGLENALQSASGRGGEKGLLNALSKAPQARGGQAPAPSDGTALASQGQTGSSDSEISRPGFSVSGEAGASIRTREGRALAAPREHVTVQRILDAGNGKSKIQFHERFGGETAGTASPPTLTVNVQASAAPPGPASPNTPHVPVSALAVHIAQQHNNGARRFDIRLDPPELGRIEVRLDVSRDGQVTTHLVVERSETLDLLQRDARQLERALQNAGLNTSEDGMTFSLKDQGLAQGGRDDSQFENNDAKSGDAKTSSGDPDLAEGDMPPPVRYTVSAGLDIRI